MRLGFGLIPALKGSTALVLALGGQAPVLPNPTIFVTLSPTAQSEGNSGTQNWTATATLVRDGSSNSFNYSMSLSGTGANPANAADFTNGLSSVSGTFVPGETVKTWTFTSVGDANVEPNETFRVTLTVAGIGTASTDGTIVNDDGLVYDYTITNDAQWATIPSQQLTNGGLIGVAPGNYAAKTLLNMNPSAPLVFVGTSPATEVFETTGQRRKTSGSKARVDRITLSACSNVYIEDLEIVTTGWVSGTAAPCVSFTTVGGGTSPYNIGLRRNYIHGGYRGNPDVPFDTLAQYPEYAGFEAVMSGGVVTGINISNSYVGDLLSPGTYTLKFLGSGGTGFAATCTVTNVTQAPYPGSTPIAGNHITSVTRTSGGSGYTNITDGNKYGLIYFETSNGAAPTWMGKLMNYAVQGTLAPGSFVAEDNVVEDCHSGFKPSVPVGSHIIRRNTIDRIYCDFIGLNKGDGDWGNVSVVANFMTRPFAKGDDPGNPHSDAVQISATPGTVRVSNNFFDANVILSGASRGAFQPLFLSDFTTGRHARLYVRSNIGVTFNIPNGLTLDNVEDGYIARNFIGQFDPTNAGNLSAVRIQASLYAGQSDLGQTALWNNIGEGFTVTNIEVDQSRSNVNMGISGTLIPYANVIVGGGSLPVTKDQAIAYFTSKAAYAGKGVNNDGYVNWATGAINAAIEPVFARFRSAVDQAASSQTTGGWSPILGGPLSKTIVADKELQIADDRAGTNATAWLAAGTYTGNYRGKYIRTRVTNSAVSSAATVSTITIDGTAFTFTSVNASTAAYPRVAFDASDRFQRAGGNLAANSRYLTMAFKGRFPSAAPGSSISLLGSGGGITRVSFTVQVSGLVRVTISNTAGTVCQFNANGASLFDGGVHEVLLSLDMEQTTAALGRSLYIDGVDRLSATGAWLGGAGVVVDHATVTGSYAFGGGTTPAMAGFEVDYFFLALGGRADITNPSVRSKFLPDQIGTTGSGVLGTQPEVFLVGNASQWNAGGGINRGSAGAFVAASGAAVTDVGAGTVWS